MSHSTPYREGYASFKADRLITICPYRPGTAQCTDWKTGFTDARLGEPTPWGKVEESRKPAWRAETMMNTAPVIGAAVESEVTRGSDDAIVVDDAPEPLERPQKRGGAQAERPAKVIPASPEKTEEVTMAKKTRAAKGTKTEEEKAEARRVYQRERNARLKAEAGVVAGGSRGRKSRAEVAGGSRGRKSRAEEQPAPSRVDVKFSADLEGLEIHVPVDLTEPEYQKITDLLWKLVNG